MQSIIPPLIAVIGSDGSGKSTVCEHLITVVEKYGAAERVHLGKQAGNVGRAVTKLPLMGNMTSVDEDFKPQAAVVFMPDSLKETLESVFTVNSIESSALEQSKEEIEQKDSQICIVFPEDFDAQVSGYDIAS